MNQKIFSSKMNESRSNDNGNEKELVDLTDFILQNRVGEGSFGKVYKVKGTKSGKIYAAKILSTQIKNLSGDKLEEISRELNIISKMNHPAVLKFIGFSPTNFKKRPKPVIITEYASKGNLEELIAIERNSPSRSNLDDTRKLIILYGIASAMSYLHSHAIIHRDLKPANILIDKYLFPKVADFGLSKVKHSNLESITMNSVVGSVKGTPIYMSPEIWENSEYTQKSDVYAFAIICYELMTNEKPYVGSNIFEIPLKVKNCYRPSFNKPIPESYKKLIVSCWSENPSNRPTFDEIVYLLKNDRGFITEKVDEKEYFEYINFINDYDVSFDQSKNIDCLDIFLKKTKKKEISNQYKDYFSIRPSIFPFNDFIQLEEICKNIVREAGFDGEKLFKIGQFLFEGQEIFPRNPMIAIKYLKESMKTGFIQAAIYYCEQLIKGDIIHRNLKKAKNLIELHIKDKDLGTYFLLCGKIAKKENDYNECKLCLEKSIALNNSKSMYEYGKIIIKNKLSISNKEKGIEFIKKAIENGCLQAMYKYGYLLLKGEEVPKNETEGIKYIKMAADKGHKDALYKCYLLESNKENANEEESFQYLKKAAYKGHVDAMYKYGNKLFSLSENNQENKKLSIAFLKKATDVGHLESMFSYGMIINDGNGVPLDHVKSTKLFKIAAKRGNLDAMVEYGTNLYTGKGIETDQDDEGAYIHNLNEAMKYFTLAADQNSKEAQSRLGLIYYEIHDIDKAIHYLTLAAEQNDLDALYNLGGLYSGENKDFPFDLDKCIHYLTLAADKGFLPAQNKLGLIYSEGLITPKDKTKSIHYLKMASDRNDANAQFNLGSIYFESGEIDKMIYYFSLAANQNHEEASNILGTCYFNGEIVDCDIDKAIHYLTIAADQNSNYSQYILGLIYSEEQYGFRDINKAIHYYLLAAKQNHPNALNDLGVIYFTGDGVTRNIEKAINYFTHAAELDHPNSQNALGDIYDEGKYVPRDVNKAIYYYSLAGKHENADALSNLGNIYYQDKEISQDIEKAIHYYTLASNLGDSYAQNMLGFIYYEGKSVPRDMNKAIEYLTLAAEQNNSKAQRNLGTIYSEGKLVPRDIRKAIHYYLQAAKQNNSDAQFCLGSIFEKGEFVPRDIGNAIYFYLLAARNYNKNALNNLGVIYSEGKYVEKDINKAIQYFTLSAEQNITNAMYGLGMIYSNEENEQFDMNKAIHYFELAADQDDSDAQFELGCIYMEGKKDVQKDIEKAIHYFKESSSSGNTEAKNNLGVIYKKGKGITPNLQTSIELFEESINEDKNFVAMFNLSNIYFFEEDAILNADKAIEMLIEILLNTGIKYAMDLLCLFVIKKFESLEQKEIVKYFEQLDEESGKVIAGKVIESIEANKLKDKACYSELISELKEINLIYIGKTIRNYDS